jgi:ssDNA-binding Zn-finger/Zn-ribbon topoisomerase 1
MAEKAKTADRAKQIQAVEEIPCPKCGKPTRVVKRVKNREMGIAGGMYNSCTACDFAAKR